MERRNRLFRSGKPDIRPFSGEDIKWLWAAYRHGSFDQHGLPEMDGQQFKAFVEENILPRYHDVDLIEDENLAFSNRRGPVALVTTFYDGWRIEPHVDWFSWATTRNVLRGTVAYLQKTRHRKDVGVVVVKSLKETKNLFDHAAEYGVVHYRARIPNGDPRGDEYLFSSMGNRRVDEQRTS